MKTLKKILLFIAIIVLFYSCTDGYPMHTVCGSQSLIIYKMEKVNDKRYGTFKYAVSDLSGKGWTLYSFKQFSVGDTLHISNCK